MVNGKGGGREECISCGKEDQLWWCDSCFNHRCTTCNQLWHHHPSRKDHKPIQFDSSCTTSDADTMSNTVDSQQNCPEWAHDDLFDDISVDIDVDEATKVYTLAERFGISKFKPFQSTIINAALKKQDTLVIQPTGSGKSICFQFPAVYRGTVTLVITPTISLMQDQSIHLQEQGIDAVYLGSAQTDPSAEQHAFSDDCRNGRLVFVSPEWLHGKNGNNLQKVKELAAHQKLGLIALDEAHLIFEWRDFREKYGQCANICTEFPDVPVMALTATATPETEQKLESILRNPVKVKGSMNRPNIFLKVCECSFSRADGSKQSVSLDKRDFNCFADTVASIIGSDQCSVIYTDFACHVSPIVLALRDRGIEAVGYYGKMRENEKRESYERWRRGTVPVIVATRAFGLGINKPDIRHVIRNGMPPSISAWSQEMGRAGRDGQPAEAHILFSHDDIQHVSFWAGDMARQHRSQDIHDSALEFSRALPFIYAHMAGKCRRKVLLGLFGEVEDAACFDGHCCDVCDLQLVETTNRKEELKLLIQAINQLENVGEKKIGEWIRGGMVSWMKDIPGDKYASDSAYGKSPSHLSLKWWRAFIRQCAAAGFIQRTIRVGTFGLVKRAYASLAVSQKGRNALENEAPVMLPDAVQYECESLSCSTDSTLNTSIPSDACASTSSVTLNKQSPVTLNAKKGGSTRNGKGCRLKTVVIELMEDNENWKEVSSKDDYQYPGVKDSNSMYYVPNVSALAQCPEQQPHFMWNDIKFSKNSSNSDKDMECCINGKLVKMRYRMAPCKGVKVCSHDQCSHTVANTAKRNTCSHHPRSALKQVSNCPVDFVYIYPVKFESDKRRWIAGINRYLRGFSGNNHNHGAPVSSKLPCFLTEKFEKAVEVNSSLTTGELMSGIAIGRSPGSADLAATNYGRVDCARKHALQRLPGYSKGLSVVASMETIADAIDEKDANSEGSSDTSKEYARVGRPYMVDYRLSSTLNLQFIMSPLMSTILADADFIEIDTTYNENAELSYLFNCTAFNYTTMRWMAVARIRGNKKSSEFYQVAFQLLFDTCKTRHPSFDFTTSLKGIILDWSDTEAAALRQVIGEENADRSMRGCVVHWARSYERVAKRVSRAVPSEYRSISTATFCKIARAITKVSTRSDVLKLFQVLAGKASPEEIRSLTESISEDTLIAIDTHCLHHWSEAEHWVEWWTRRKHLQMLSKPFSNMPKDWSSGPHDTNAVERCNRAAKSSHTTSLIKPWLICTKKTRQKHSRL